MPLLNKYLVVARDVGGFDPVEDEKIIGDVGKTVKTVAESVGDLQSFCSELKPQLITRFDKNVNAKVAGVVGKTISAKIHIDIWNNDDKKILVRAQPVKGAHQTVVVMNIQVIFSSLF